jgi:hypothetical protein
MKQILLGKVRFPLKCLEGSDTYTSSMERNNSEDRVKPQVDRKTKKLNKKKLPNDIFEISEEEQSPKHKKGESKGHNFPKVGGDR